MLVWVRWTVTQSSGWAAVLAGLALLLELALALELALGLELWLGLAAMSASRVAEAVADGEVWDGDGEDEPVWDGEPEGEVDADAGAEVDAPGELEPEPDGDGDVLPGVLVGSVPDGAGAVGEEELEEAEGDGDGESDGDGDGESDGDGDGESDGDGDFDGVGVGVAVAAAGSASHVVSMFALALAEGLGVAEAVPACIVSARAAPGHPASTPRVSDPPASTLSTAARTCARRMKTALSPLLIELLCALHGVRRRLGDGWVRIVISGAGRVMRTPVLSDHGWTVLAVRRPGQMMGRSPPPIGSPSARNFRPGIFVQVMDATIGHERG